MNKYFDYPQKKYWGANMWGPEKRSTVNPLVEYISKIQVLDETPYPNAPEGLYGDACKVLPYFDRKTNCVSIPEVVKYWNDKGVHYERRSQGGIGWIMMAPKKCFDEFGKKLPVLLVFNNVDPNEDPYWAMKTLDTYKEYNEMLAETLDMIILYVVYGVKYRSRVYTGVLAENFVFGPGDTDRLYLDVSPILNAGKTVKGAEGFTYKDDEGNVVDPDTRITGFGSLNIPSLKISKRWYNRTSLTREQLTNEAHSRPGYEAARVINSESGRLMAEGIELEYNYNDATHPGFVQHWADMGLLYESHETQFRRWKTAIPKSAFENPDKKLPVICVMHEVNRSNDHLAIISASFFYEYFRLAAQGECMVINFVLEDMDSNDLLVDIIHEAFEMYPFIDKTRVYVSGHSHNGLYSQEFAFRHPDLIAACTILGNNPGIAPGGITEMDDARIEAFSKVDMPAIIMNGYDEDRIHYPLSTDAVPVCPAQKPPVPTFELRAKSWQARLKAHNCPMKTTEEIAACQNSSEGAIRKLGVPGDRSETLWLDGFELYVVDVKNNNGKYHLRMVAEENITHNTSPNQLKLSWSFMRRFARDLETGEVIELY